MEFFNQNKPANKQQPATGKLLIAEPFLADPNFSRTVILLCEHGESGTVGFILNRSTELTLGDLLPELYTPSLTIYQGGPVQMDTLHMVHRIPLSLGGNRIADDIYWGGSYEALQEVVENSAYSPDDMRLYVGYSGWSEGQLEKEMEEGSWLVTDATPHLLFDTKPEDIWKEAIRQLGKEYAFLANMPLNPQLN
jgi:putative transcriptional regulator